LRNSFSLLHLYVYSTDHCEKKNVRDLPNIRHIGEPGPVVLDTLVGMSTGIIGSLFYRYTDQSQCLASIFLGTMYWFFYGTAFVIGLLEVVSGELETGVTRFIARLRFSISFLGFGGRWEEGGGAVFF
jgi:hypothetical protein